MRRRARFVYDVAGDWTTDLTTKPWVPVDNTVGGSLTSAAGIPASYIVRRDELVEVTLRVTEAEWPDLLALIAFGQTAESFLWYPDADENDPIEVYLESPLAGERWTPTRQGGYERLFEVTLTLRSLDAGTFQAYFTED